MTVAENVALVERYFDEIWNKGNLAREADFVAQDIDVHTPPIADLPGGIAGPLAIVGMFRAALPDIHLTHDLIFGEGDRVVHHWTAHGTHTGSDLMGVAASGHQLTMTGMNEFRVADGRIAERWGTMDIMGLLQQLGLVPTPGAPPAPAAV